MPKRKRHDRTEVYVHDPKNPAKGRTDWARLRAMTDEDIDRQIAENPDAAPSLDEGWLKNAVLVVPERKVLISLRVDPDVLEFFRSGGEGYQTRMNHVLQSFVAYYRGRTGSGQRDQGMHVHEGKDVVRERKAIGTGKIYTARSVEGPGWVNRVKGAVVSRHATRASAIARAQRIAAEKGLEHIVHGKERNARSTAPGERGRVRKKPAK